MCRTSPSARWCARRCARTWSCAARRAPDGEGRRRPGPGVRQGGGQHHQLPSPGLRVTSTAPSRMIREHGCKRAWSSNPATPLELPSTHTLEGLRPGLIMSVNRGSAASSYITLRAPQDRRGAGRIDRRARTSGFEGRRRHKAGQYCAGSSRRRRTLCRLGDFRRTRLRRGDPRHALAARCGKSFRRAASLRTLESLPWR